MEQIEQTSYHDKIEARYDEALRIIEELKNQKEEVKEK